MQRSAVREFVKLTTDPSMISFAGGLPAPELFPLEAMQEAAGRVFSQIGPRALQYGESEGEPALREWLANSFSTPSFQVRREHVLITHGAQQALQLLGWVLLNEGDAVLVENPTYLALLSAWRPLAVRFVPLPSDQDGLQVETLEKQIAELPASPKVLYVQPNFQNPQGTTLSAARRAALAAWAEAHDVLLLEDNAYGELRYEGEALPHLLHVGACSAATPDDRAVVHVGTFSKVIAPGLRVGWVIGPAPVIDKLTQAKQAADLHTGTLNQLLVLDLLQKGFLEQHLPVLRNAYRTRRDTMLAALARHFTGRMTWTKPAGGLFLMATLPPDCRAKDLLPEALARQVAFVPGDEFHVDGTGANTFRLNFSNATPEQIEEGILRLQQSAKGQRAKLKAQS